MISVIKFYLMHLQTVLIKPDPASQFKFHILSFESKYSELQRNMSRNRNEPKVANYRGVKLDKATCQQITAEITQTYDLYKFAIQRSNGSGLLKIPPYKTI